LPSPRKERGLRWVARREAMRRACSACTNPTPFEDSELVKKLTIDNCKLAIANWKGRKSVHFNLQFAIVNCQFSISCHALRACHPASGAARRGHKPKGNPRCAERCR